MEISKRLKKLIFKYLLKDLYKVEIIYYRDSVWFIDSLINGNLKELSAFTKGLVERNIQLSWMGKYDFVCTVSTILSLECTNLQSTQSA